MADGPGDAALTCPSCFRLLWARRWFTVCDRTNNSSLMATLYGQRDAGFFGCESGLWSKSGGGRAVAGPTFTDADCCLSADVLDSHFTGGFPGGQAEYVKVPFGDVNTVSTESAVCRPLAVRPPR